ncbi:MAG: hypothetical protein LBU34_10705 [Planctomycetaceae bacterium]|nr:hypothetical protein [Planctomycetaceae bacterium]
MYEIKVGESRCSCYGEGLSPNGCLEYAEGRAESPQYISVGQRPTKKEHHKRESPNGAT